MKDKNKQISAPVGTITDWDDNQWASFRDWLVLVLENNERVAVTFTKADGSDRTMQCTRQFDQIMANDNQTLLESLHTKKSKNVSLETKENNITVYDVEKQGWRSFKVRNITNIHALILKYSK